MSESAKIFLIVTCSLTKKKIYLNENLFLLLVLVLEYFSYTDYAKEKCQTRKS